MKSNLITGHEIPQSSSSGAEAGIRASSSYNTIRELFHIWWNGRLIPLTRLGSVKWCSPPKIEDEVRYSRLSGSLFFDSGVTAITINKLNFENVSELLKYITITPTTRMDADVQTVLKNVSVEADGTFRSGGTGRDFSKNFQKWVENSSLLHDKEVKYSGLMDINGEAF